MSTGYLARAFDLIDVRDLDLINQASSRCDSLVVGVYTDEYFERRFGRRPIVPEGERVALVEQLRGVARAVPHVDGTQQVGELRFATADDADTEVPSGADVVELAARRASSSDLLRLLESRRPTAVA